MQTWALVFTRVPRGCVIQRCQNKNPRKELTREVNDDMPKSAEGLGDLKKGVNWVPASERESRDLELGEARQLCALRAPRVGWVESWRCKSSQHRKIVSFSLHVEKRFNSKVIKSFVPELRSRKVFRVYFGFPMPISHIRISGYVTLGHTESMDYHWHHMKMNRVVVYNDCISAKSKTPTSPTSVLNIKL